MKYVFNYILLVLYVNGFAQEQTTALEVIKQIEKSFISIGLQPPFHNYYLQTIPVYQDSLNKVQLSVDNNILKKDTDFVVTHNSTFNVSFAASEVLFVGYGLSDSTRDDYKDVNARGKIVMVFPGAEYKVVKGKKIEGHIPDHHTLQQAAQKNGAIALLITDKNFPRLPDAATGPIYMKDAQWEGVPNTFIISDSVGRKIMGTDYYIAQRIMKNTPPPPKSCYTTVKLELDKRTERLEKNNVAGVVPGTNNTDEFILIYAPTSSSYVNELISLAREFTESIRAGHSPKRTVLFAAVFDHEVGIKQLLNNSGFTSDKLVATFNLADETQQISYEHISKAANMD